MKGRKKPTQENPSRAILFDNEWVLVRNDWGRSSRLASKAYGEPILSGEEFKKALQVPIIKNGKKVDTLTEYCCGRSSAEEFYSAVLRSPHIQSTEKNIQFMKVALEELTTEADEDAVNFLRRLNEGGKYKLMMLSNTNPDSLSGNRKRHEYFNIFDQCYFSFEIGARKPEPAAYQRVLDDQELMPSQYLYIDDEQENLKTAEALGMRTLHHKIGSGKLSEKLSHLLI